MSDFRNIIQLLWRKALAKRFSGGCVSPEQRSEGYARDEPGKKL